MPDVLSGIGAGVSLIGSGMQNDAAGDQIQSQADAAARAAEMSRFRPFGITSRFGKSGFTTDAQGNVISGGYEAAPDVAAMREYLLNQSKTGLGQFGQAQQQQQFLNQQAQGLLNLGSQYIAQSPQAAAQDWMSKQQALLTPARDTAYARMQQNLFNTGRGGLSVAQGGNLGAANPESQAYYNAITQQDAQLAAQAQQAGQQQTTFGAGLFGAGLGTMREGYQTQTAALQPWQSAFQGANMLEGAAQGALDTGSALGAQQSSANANAGRFMAGTGTGTGVSSLGVGLMNLAQTPGLFGGATQPGTSTGGSKAFWSGGNWLNF